ncbi:phospholipase-like protein [Tanacetum coccineum]
MSCSIVVVFLPCAAGNVSICTMRALYISSGGKEIEMSDFEGRVNASFLPSYGDYEFSEAMRAIEQKTRDLDVECKQLKAFKAFTTNMMSEMDIDSLTIKQYLMLTEGIQAPGIGSYFPTKYDSKNVNSFNHKESWNLGYKYHSDDSKINTHYDLPSFLPCFEPIQPHTQDKYESLDEDTDFVSEDESEIEDDEEGDASGALPCQLPPKELNLGSFTLPCTINGFNLYSMVDLGASVNVMPKSIFEHLKLASLKETSMVVEMADMTKKAPLGIVENILDCGMWPTCNLNLSFCSGYDAIYGKGENGMLEQWMCFRDHERQSVGGNRMIFDDFLKVRYGSKSIDDTTRER